ncbi:hypothetical protein BGW80DRAFT_263797 [Lactifluus volemus]|nr:hypothetical protein BGW80DRAFT_263797 [Lactifluus volemus]
MKNFFFFLLIHNASCPSNMLYCVQEVLSRHGQHSKFYSFFIQVRFQINHVLATPLLFQIHWQRKSIRCSWQLESLFGQIPLSTRPFPVLSSHVIFLVGTNQRHEAAELNSRVLQENEGLDVSVPTSADKSFHVIRKWYSTGP